MRRVLPALIALSVLAAAQNIPPIAPLPEPPNIAIKANSALKEKWQRIGTDDFELYTNAGDTAAREALNHLQQVRAFFLKASPLPLLDQFPVRIVLFKAPEQLAPFTPSAGQRAFFVNSPKRDYIVMADSPSDYQYAIHEYMHLIVRHSGLRLPTWLNEGWADVYSTLRPVPDGVAVGDLAPNRVKALQSGEWLDIKTLTSVDSKSDIYNGKGPTAMFYAESWALAHMLFLAPDYADNFPKFLGAIHRGQNFAESCQTAFGKTPEQVFQDLRKYFDRKKMYGKIFEAPLGKKGALPEVAKVDPFEVHLLLTDLTAAMGRGADARKEYAELAQAEPNRYQVAESLGYLDIAEKNFTAARTEFEKAFAAGDPDPRMCVQLAYLEQSNKQPASAMIPPLERAVQSKPDYTDALLQLGLLKIAAREYRTGVDMLMKVQQIRPEQATPVYSALAYGNLQLADLPRARRDANTAKQYTRDAAQIKNLDAMIALIDARAASPLAPKPGEKTEHAEGALRQIDCSPSGNRMVLTIGNKGMIFELPDTKAIEFIQKGEVALKMACGPQPPVWVKVEYAPAAVVDKTSDGIVRLLEY